MSSNLPSPPCPSCNGTLGFTFYEGLGVPTQSNRVLFTRNEALAFPRGDLRLVFCRACGFVWNSAFTVNPNEHASKYETAQGCSPAFNAFARSLARLWADRYQLRGKTVLEIGCGDGHFLAILCETAQARGIGVDPLVDSARAPAGRDLTYIKDVYCERYAHLPVDFICCRHTLEHIPDPAQFLRTVRRVIGERRQTIVAFEVPDVLRVLREGAFWDVYYEHCSYFSAGSLARLFRACGFDLLDLRPEYGDQYVVIEATPALGPAQPLHTLENDLPALAGTLAAFGSIGPAAVSRWRHRLGDLLAAGRRIALWGSGSKAVGFLTTLGFGNEIPYVVDINPTKQGTYLPKTGQQVVAPALLA